MRLILSSSTLQSLSTIRLDYFRKDYNFIVQTCVIKNVIKLLRAHFTSQLKILSWISGTDCLGSGSLRFCVAYELLSLKYNFRLRLKVVADGLAPLESLRPEVPGAYWWECEVWDMFGIYFLGETVPVRLLTDYGFQGYPLKKSFPLTSYAETAYNLTKNRVFYEKTELSQEFRVFGFTSPWEIFAKTVVV